MPLQNHAKLGHVHLNAAVASIGASPVTGVFVSPVAGRITGVGVASYGAAAGAAVFTVYVNGVSVGTFNQTLGTSVGALQDFPQVDVNEGDSIAIVPTTPGTGAAIPGAYAVRIRS
jgi:hypothetical protein